MLKRWWRYIVLRFFTPHPRPVRGYVPRELPETPTVPEPEPESESGFPWSITRKLEAGIPLSSAEEWTVLMWQEGAERWR